jgi:hypothetical protein
VNRSKIEAFWSFFKENMGDYANFNEDYENNPVETSEKVDKLIQELQKFSEGLFILIKSDNEPKELIVTAKGKKEYFADAFEVVNNAPTIEGWKFIATKPSYGLDFDFELTGVKINPESLSFMPLEADEYPNDVAIRIFHKEYTQEPSAQQTAVVVGAYAGLDILFGEVDSVLNFQYIDFDDMPHPKEKSYPFSGLKDYIEYKKGQRLNNGKEFPKEDTIIMEGKIDELPSLLVLNKSLDYYEFTQKFPYLLQLTLSLKNAGDNGLPQGNVDELYLIEDIIYQEIYKSKKGHFIARETYNGKRDLFYYADSKGSIANALNMLPKEYESCEVQYSIDYDPFWVRVDRYRDL